MCRESVVPLLMVARYRSVIFHTSAEEMPFYFISKFIVAVPIAFLSQCLLFMLKADP